MSTPKTNQLRLFRSLSEIEPVIVKWLWYPHVPLGKITVLQARPGMNKTTLALDIAARTTTGELDNPFDIGHPRGCVVYLSSEDGAADTLRPRFEVAGGDLSKIQVIDPKTATQILLPRDLDNLKNECLRVQAKLLVIDTIPTFMEGSISNVQSVNRALLPLSKLAEQLEMAVIVIRHLRKTKGDDLLNLGSGSIAVSGIARSVLHIDKHPSGEGVRVLVQVKPNLVPQEQGLEFAVEDSEHGAPMIRYTGTSEYTAGSLSAWYRNPRTTAKKLLKAKDMLRRRLQKGSVLATEIKLFAETLGISEPTLNRAKSRMGVYSIRESGHWYWVLPEREIPAKDDTHAEQGDQLGVADGRDSTPLQPSENSTVLAQKGITGQDDHHTDDHLSDYRQLKLPLLAEAVTVQ